VKKAKDFKFTSLELPTTPNLDDRLSRCPTEPGVYLMKDELGHVIYVGKAKSLRSRVRSYFQNAADLGVKTQHLVTKIHDIELMQTGSEVEALLLENTLIKRFKPKYNIRLKDDKSYPYLMLDLKHAYPRAYVARKQNRNDGNEYFGPFPMSGALRTSLSAASQVFQLRDCRDHDFANRSRPCLSFEIGHCTAPCVKKVSSDEYADQVKDFTRFMRGDTQKLELEWEQQMNKSAEALDFERAGRLRDRIEAIRMTIGQEQRMVSTGDVQSRDMWALWPSDRLSEAPRISILVLQFREGRLQAQIHRRADASVGVETEDTLLSFLLQFYTKHELPKELVLPVGFAVPRDETFGLALVKINESVSEGEREVPVLKSAQDTAELLKLAELASQNVKALYDESEEYEGESERALSEVARLLDMDKLPARMECVDISNFQGEANVGSCVVFTNGRPDKQHYRHYNIQGFDGQNDFASMRELLLRRYGKPDSPRPDLLVIDGGRGQLGVATEVLKELKLDFRVVGLAKARTKRDFKSSEVEASEERIFVPGQVNPLKIRSKEALRILTFLRDEAHRFAIEFHRLKRDSKRSP
jgi:excinuclease ABC subunit C